MNILLIATATRVGVFATSQPAALAEEVGKEVHIDETWILPCLAAVTVCRETCQRLADFRIGMDAGWYATDLHTVIARLAHVIHLMGHDAPVVRGHVYPKVRCGVAA